MTDTGEQVLAKFAKMAAGLDQRDWEVTQAMQRGQSLEEARKSVAVARGGRLGLSDVAALELQRQGESGFAASIEDANKRLAIMKQDEEASRNLIKAQTDLANSWDKLARGVHDLWDPVEIFFDNLAKRLLDTFTEEPGSQDTGASPQSWWGAHMPPILGGAARAPVSVFKPETWWYGNSATSGGGVLPSTSPQSAWTSPPQGSTSSPLDAFFNWGGLRSGGQGFQSFTSPEAGVQAVRDNLLRNYQNMTLAQIVSKWAPASDNNDTALLIQRASRMMGMAPNAAVNINDAETMRRLVTMLIANEHGGAIPPGLSQATIDRSLGAGMGGAGAYGVPGAVMNYGSTGAMGAPGSNLVQITAPNGEKVTVNRAAAPAFQAFLADLASRGYKMKSVQGYNMRDKTGGGGLSEHAYGAAIDVNPAKNPYGGHATDLPANIHDIAAKYGLVWGGDWKTNPDPMHFQWGGPGAGTTAIASQAPIKYGIGGGQPSPASSGWLSEITSNLRLIREANAAPASTTINHGDVNVNVGDVHTQATDAKGIAYELGGAVERDIRRRTQTVAMSNSGQQQ